MEKVQRRATKQVDGMNEMPYQDRMRKLKLPSMQYRRKRGDLIHMFKVAKGLDKILISDIAKKSNKLHLRGHNEKLDTRSARGEQRKKIFAENLPKS